MRSFEIVLELRVLDLISLTRNKEELELRFLFYFIIVLQVSHHTKEESAVCVTHGYPLAVIFTHV